MNRADFEFERFRRRVRWQRAVGTLVVEVVLTGILLAVIGPEELKERIQHKPVEWVTAAVVTYTLLPLIVYLSPRRLGHPAVIELVTSSDWTTLRLVRGAGWAEFDLDTRSVEATTAEFDGELIRLAQPLECAQQGGVVAMMARITLYDVDWLQTPAAVVDRPVQLFSPRKIDFEIERGHLGWTHVRLMNNLHEDRSTVEHFWWGSIVPGERNARTVQAPASELFGKLPPFVYHVPAALTMDRKALLGYQGWFACPGDGSDWNEWVHWFRNNTPDSAHLTVDFWPDVNQSGPEEQFATGLALADGRPAPLFSSYVRDTVLRHFQWMEEHNLDGVFQQRFLAGLSDPRIFCFRNKVLQNVRLAAERHGRVFAVMYDLSGASPNDPDLGLPHETIMRDWTFLIDVLDLIGSPNYLRHNGRPVVGVWGLGFRNLDPAHDNMTSYRGEQLVDWLQSGASYRYQAAVVAGVPSAWRDPLVWNDWQDVYRAVDVISPWSVGRYHSISEADDWREDHLVPDLAQAAQMGVDYMPVVWPGFSWHNLCRQRVPPCSPEAAVLNWVPRQGGNFYWQQVRNAVAAGARMLNIAMFDEVDEGTAMFPVVASGRDMPAGAALVPLDADGYDLSSDWYLQLAGRTGQMLRGEIPPTAGITP